MGDCRRAAAMMREPVSRTAALRSFDVLKSAYLAWRAFLLRDGRWRPEDFKTFYLAEIDAPFKADPLLDRARFDHQLFPSLWDGLPILQGATAPPALALSTLGDDWPGSSLAAQLTNNPLARVLLAFIWKQGDLLKVNHVLKGMQEQRRPEHGDAFVLWQFGRHLADPWTQPIFDQHTSRHRLVLRRMRPGRRGRIPLSYDQYVHLFGRRRSLIPAHEASLRNARRGKQFIIWWKRAVEPRLPHVDSGPPARAEAIVWSDRIMFCLGKAAEIVRRIHEAKGDSEPRSTP